MLKIEYSWIFSIFLHKIFIFEKTIFENFKISTNNIISVQAAKAPQHREVRA